MNKQQFIDVVSFSNHNNRILLRGLGKNSNIIAIHHLKLLNLIDSYLQFSYLIFPPCHRLVILLAPLLHLWFNHYNLDL